MSVLGDGEAACVSGETWQHLLASVSLEHGMGLLLVTTYDPLLPRCCFCLLPFSRALRDLVRIKHTFCHISCTSMCKVTASWQVCLLSLLIESHSGLGGRDL